MSHYTQSQFVRFARELLPGYFRGVRVLEIGSQDLNGSPRPLFSDASYTGIDVAAGPGVDVVCRGEDFDAPDGSYDCVLSFEVMEHNPAWARTFLNMVRVTRAGGLVLMSCATLGRPEHGTTRSQPQDSPLTLDWDYYRNLTAADFKKTADLKRLFAAHGFFSYFYGSDLFFLGVTAGAGVDEIKSARRALRVLATRYVARNVLQWHALKKLVLLKTIGERRYFALTGRTPTGLSA